MAVRSRYDASVVSDSVAAIATGLNTRLSEVNDAVYDTLTTEIAELRVDQHLLDLLRASIEGNVDTIFQALQCDIPLDHIEPPTASLEYARRLAQHGVPVNALVRAYRLGQHVVTNRLLTEIIAAPDLEPDLGLHVVARTTDLIGGYIDWISQQVVATYEDERERWLETRNSVRAVRVRELLDAPGEVDIDAVSTAMGIRYGARTWASCCGTRTNPGTNSAGSNGSCATSPTRSRRRRTRCSSRPIGYRAGRGFRSLGPRYLCV